MAVQAYKEFKENYDNEVRTMASMIMERVGLMDVDSILIMENEDPDIIVEGIMDNLNSALNKIGLKIEREKGLIDYLLAAGKTMAQFFLAALRGDKKTLKQLANKEISKEALVDFVYKLDGATMHVLAGPLHFIEAVTGWNIAANFEREGMATKIRKTVSTFKDAIAFLYEKVKAAFKGKTQKKLLNRIKAIEKQLTPQFLDI